MNWINEIRSEIISLEISRKKLRNFGILIGGIFIIISAWLVFKNHQNLAIYLLFSLGIILFSGGLFVPDLLKTVYKIWMGISIIIGWFVSRIILTILYFIVITPLGLILRLSGKKFLDIDFKDKQESYWIIKPETKKSNYKEMY